MNKKAVFLAFAAWLAVGGFALAQAPADPDLVNIPVSVTGPKNAYVAGLKKENFKLLEDGIEQTVTSFVAEDQAPDIDIILALGNLTRGRATHDSQKIREAVENFRQQSNPKTKFTVEEMPFGANGIWDSMSMHITRLSEVSTNPKKILVVLTDGFQDSAGEPERALQEYAKKLRVPIYIIFAASAAPVTESGSRGADDLATLTRGAQIHLSGGTAYEDLTKYTGGKLFQAEADTQLRAALESLAQEFKTQYILGFKSTNDAKDDKWRSLKVSMVGAPAGMKEKDLKVKVRDRYFVAKKKK